LFIIKLIRKEEIKDLAGEEIRTPELTKRPDPESGASRPRFISINVFDHSATPAHKGIRATYIRATYVFLMRPL